MIRVLVGIAVLFGAVFLLDWLGGVPIQVAINWPGGAMAPPLRVVVVSLLVFALAAIVLWKLISGILHTPGAVRGFFRARRRDRGYQALSRGMIAVGSGDTRLAHRYAGEAGKLIAQEPLVLLLDAQTAQLEGRRDDARSAFTRMLDDPETRLLGLRGLFIEANRAGETDAARHYASEAQRIAPGVPWAATATMEYQSSEHDWAGALATLEQSAGARLVDKAQARRLRAVLLTARALDVEDAEPEKARGFALEAHRLAPDFVPAATVAARVLTRLNDTRKAAKVVETTWKQSPHPDLAEAYLHVRPGDSGQDRLKRARVLAGLRSHHPECAVTLARAALDVRDFALARDQLAKALRQSPTQRVCLMMAELEEAEHGDRGRVREWLARAVRAPRDEAWTADGVVSDTWQPVSPVTGRLDAFEWRVPVSTDSGATELDGSDLAERAALPLETPTLPTYAGDAPAGHAADAEEPAPAVQPVAAHAEPVRTADARPVETRPSEPRSAATRPAPSPAAAAEPVRPAPPKPAAAPVSYFSLTPSANPGGPLPTRLPLPIYGPSGGPAKTARPSASAERPRLTEYPLPFRPDDPGPVDDQEPPKPRVKTGVFG
ncbi:heme biosynthesis protein HemY [Chthonobacter rhizosphaerae]|uniref:heme biosynthesis protein HemY n=1 Tax=Chthonobacter rhizosphaerae TaxID=2735553 RepID=UPI0015EFA7EF|nr:heme biosynthesis HemY N-terminal domain-containing protein [Chthonobacter rhizosphaerae]